MTIRLCALTSVLLLLPLFSSAADVNISLTDTGFVPKHVTINPGDKVTWYNNSSRVHTIVSDTGLFSTESSTGAVFSPGSVYWRTFSSEGIYPYYSKQFGGPGGVGISGTIAVTIPGLSTSVPPPAGVIPTTGVIPGTTGTNVSVDVLKQQVAALLERVRALQGQTGGATTGTGGTSLQCPHISRTLKIGSSGSDVTRLQRFLATDPAIYPEAQITGYYGALTEAAVKRFQCKNKIVCEGTPDTTGYGVTGPRTAALLALQCPDVLSTGGSSPTPSGFMRVTPTTGAAPLTVTVELTLNTARSCAASSYEVHYGDSSQPVIVNVPINLCAEQKQTLSHVYTKGGTYTVMLRSGVHQNTATVTVTGSASPTGSDTLNANPTSGAAPLTVAFSGVANASGSCSPGPYTIQFGDGQNASIPLSGCSPVSYAINHTYSTGGTFIARLYRGSPATEASSLAVTVTGGNSSQSSSGGAFSVTAGAGGNPLAVQASFPLTSSCSRFELNWGDSTQVVSQDEGTCNAGSVTKQYTHTYTNGGTYTLTLKRGATLQFVDTASVVIAN